MKKILFLITLTCSAFCQEWFEIVLTNEQGKVVALETFKSNQVIFEWVDFNCAHAMKTYESGKVQELQQFAKEKNISWVSIQPSINKTLSPKGDDLKIQLSIQKHKGTHYLLDPANDLSKIFNVKQAPTLVYLSSLGETLYHGPSITSDTLKITELEQIDILELPIVELIQAEEPSPVILEKWKSCPF